VTPAELQTKFDELLRLPAETEWVEFKHNNENPQQIGEYLSAISNGAALHGKRTGYLAWGIEDASHAVLGTTFRPKLAKKGNENLENWLLHQLSPRIDFTIYEFERNGPPSYSSPFRQPTRLRSASAAKPIFASAATRRS